MRDRLFCLLGIFALVCAVPLTGWSQSAVPRAQAASGNGFGGQGFGAFDAPAAVPVRPDLMADPDRKLTVGDELSFEIVEDHEPAPQAKRVSASGDVDIYPVGGIRVAGLTTAQAASTIKRQLDADFYYNATVRLNLVRVNREASMGMVYLSGEVNRVGAQQIYSERPLTVSQAILNASGFARFANERKVEVTRQGRGGAPQRFIIDVKDIIKEGRVEKDMILQDGDRINVPKVWGKI